MSESLTLEAPKCQEVGSPGAALAASGLPSSPPWPELKTTTTNSLPNSSGSPVWDFWRKGVYMALRETGRFNQAERFLNCGKAIKLYCAEAGHEKAGSQFCMARYCPECAHRQAMKIHRRVMRRLRNKDHIYGWGPKVITLTIKTDRQYAECIAIIQKALPKFFKACLWRDSQGRDWNAVRRLKGPKECASGAILGIEMGPENGNVHAHVVYYGPYVHQAHMREVWERLIQRPGSVWVEASRSGLKSALKEGVKYMSDIRKLDGHQVVEFFEHLEGVRRLRSYGIFQGLEKDETDEDVPVKCEHCGCTEWITEEGLQWMLHRAHEVEVSPPEVFKAAARALMEERTLDMWRISEEGEAYQIPTNDRRA